MIVQLDKNHEGKLSKFLLNIIKTNISKLLGTSLEATSEEINLRRKFNSNVLYIFIRSCYTPKAISVISSQARSLGLSLTFSYPNIREFEGYSDKENTESLIANTNTKIFSTIEEDEATVYLLNRLKDDVSQRTILEINNDEISISIKTIQKKHDHIWVVKSGHASQISFDCPFENIVSS